jgi:hypothetical protein
LNADNISRYEGGRREMSRFKTPLHSPSLRKNMIKILVLIMTLRPDSDTKRDLDLLA